MKKIFFVLLILGFLSSCKEDMVIDSGQPTFNIDLFNENLQAAFEENTAGHQFTITQNGLLYEEVADGYAVRPFDGDGTVEMSAHSKMTIASLSKPITAVAVLKAAEELGIPLSTPFTNFLPSTWTVHSSLEEVTIEDLLRHQSGIINSGNTYEGLRNLAAEGVIESDIGTLEYNNANFSFFRVVLPYMIATPALVTLEILGADMAESTALYFYNYMIAHIFGPLGINTSFAPIGSNPTLLYNCSGSSNGTLVGNYFLRAGAFGWQLSSFDLANFLTHLRYDDDFFSPEMREIMFDRRLGIFRTAGDHGDYFRHNGIWNVGGDSQGMRGSVWMFPNNVEVSVLINCRFSGLDSEILEAYENAWE